MLLVGVMRLPTPLAEPEGSSDLPLLTLDFPPIYWTSRPQAALLTLHAHGQQTSFNRFPRIVEMDRDYLTAIAAHMLNLGCLTLIEGLDKIRL
jgi:hypothetical protein